MLVSPLDMGGGAGSPAMAGSSDINTLVPVFLPVSLGELRLCSTCSLPTLSTVEGNRDAAVVAIRKSEASLM